MIGPPKPHDFDVGALDKATNDKGSVGRAWKNPNGSIAVVLNPFVKLEQHSRDLLITLFPVKGKNHD